MEPSMRQGKPITYQTPQELQNQSFDRDYQVNVVESMTVNPVTGNIERPVAIQGNASISITESVLGSVTTKMITKTIGTDTYTKTIAINSSDNSVTVSTWSTV